MSSDATHRGIIIRQQDTTERLAAADTLTRIAARHNTTRDETTTILDMLGLLDPTGPVDPAEAPQRAIVQMRGRRMGARA